MKLDKRTENILVIFGGLVIIILPIYIYIKQISYQMSEGSRIAIQSFDPSTEIGKANLERRKKTNDVYAYIQLARHFLDTKEYEKSIDCYQRAINLSNSYGFQKYGFDEWVCRSGLVDAYAGSARYKEAIQELDWLIAQKPRQEVLKGFVDRKEVLLKKMQTKEQSTPP